MVSREEEIQAGKLVRSREKSGREGAAWRSEKLNWQDSFILNLNIWNLSGKTYLHFHLHFQLDLRFQLDSSSPT